MLPLSRIATDMNETILSNKHIDLCTGLRDVGATPYIVGGCVRDMLLGRRPKDIDIVVVGIDENDLIDRMDAAGWNIKCVGAAFPVYLINDIEVALARKEHKVAEGHRGFECDTANITLEEDLFRRDLTINAIAMDPFSGDIIDPYNGVQHIKGQILNPVSQHFAEDPLRVLRAARFAAQLDFNSTDELKLAAANVLPELIDLSGERVFGELLKALRSDRPSKFITVLDELGALEIVFPEIYNLKGRVQPEKYHPEGDAYVHTLLVLDRCRALGGDDETMYAALLHDLGKAVTPDDNLPHHYDHERLGVPLVRTLSERIKAPTSFRKTAETASREHLNVHRFDTMKPIKKVRMIVRLGALQNDLLLRRVALASQADAQGRGPDFIDAPYPSRINLIKAAEVARSVRGHEFAHLKNGRVIAQKMEAARAKALEAAGFRKVGNSYGNN
jgi:tRNA nucleotidyltransferase (CCA-adding enzyme)